MANSRAQNYGSIVAQSKAVEQVTYTGYSALSGIFIKFKTELVNTASELISFDNTSYSKVTASKRCLVHATFSSRRGNSGNWNGYVQISDPSDNEYYRVGTYSETGNWANSGLSFILEPGYSVVFQMGGDPGYDSSLFNFSVVAEEL